MQVPFNTKPKEVHVYTYDICKPKKIIKVSIANVCCFASRGSVMNICGSYQVVMQYNRIEKQRYL